MFVLVFLGADFAGRSHVKAVWAITSSSSITPVAVCGISRYLAPFFYTNAPLNGDDVVASVCISVGLGTPNFGRLLEAIDAIDARREAAIVATAAAAAAL